MKVFWGRGGRNVGREVRYIYVEWGEGGAVTRIAIPPTLGEDTVREILGELLEALRRTPPVVVERRNVCRVLAECEYFVAYFPERFVKPLRVYAQIDYTPFWRRVREAKVVVDDLWEPGSGEPWWFPVPVSIDPPLVRFQAAEGVEALVPEELWHAWQRLKSRYEELLKELLALAEQTAAAGSDSEGLEVEFEG